MDASTVWHWLVEDGWAYSVSAGAVVATLAPLLIGLARGNQDTEKIAPAIEQIRQDLEPAPPSQLKTDVLGEINQFARRDPALVDLRRFLSGLRYKHEPRFLPIGTIRDSTDVAVILRRGEERLRDMLGWYPSMGNFSKELSGKIGALLVTIFAIARQEALLPESEVLDIAAAAIFVFTWVVLAMAERRKRMD